MTLNLSPTDELERRRMHAQLQSEMFGRAMTVRLGRYVLGSRLGHGAMGVVYRARDPNLRRDVALKVLQLRGARSVVERGHRRLRREARALGRVSHPNVVEVFDVGVDDNRVFIAMELVEGQSLDRWLQVEPRSPREIVDAFVEAGRGLVAAHAAGVIHRDFKPANVLVGHDGRVKVGDFGLARGLLGRPSSSHGSVSETGAESVTTAGDIAGTPKYMAPAQRAGAPADALSDQYAFCVSLAEALEQRAQGSRVPSRVRASIERGLSEHPGERHPSMERLLARLRPPALSGRSVLLGAVALLVVGGGGLVLGAGPVDPVSATPKAAVTEVASSERLDEVRGLIDQIQSLWKARRYEDGLELSAAAVDSAGELSDPGLSAKAGLWHGRLEEKAGHPADAVESWTEAHADAVTAGDPRVEFDAAFELARVLTQTLVDLDAAERWTRQAESALQQLEDAAHQRNSLAQLQVALREAQGDREGALEAARRFVEVADEAYGRRSNAAVRARHALGLTYFNLQRLPEAHDALSEGLELAASVGHRELQADCMQVLAGVESILGQLNDEPERAPRAVELAGGALEIYEGMYGPDHPITLNARLTFGNILSDADRREDALAELETALVGLKARLGEDSPQVATVHENLGIVLSQLKRYEEAEQHLQRGVIILEANRGPKWPGLCSLLDQLGDTQRRRGAFDAARRTYRRAISIAEESGTPTQVGFAYDGLAVVEAQTGHHQEAADLFDKTADALTEGLGPNHPRVTETRQWAAEERAAAGQR